MVSRTLASRMWFFIAMLCSVMFIFYFEMRIMKLEDSKRKLGNAKSAMIKIMAMFFT
jgi:hypothetical protein